jgi:tetratricopeptide (TPR) repeat protein
MGQDDLAHRHLAAALALRPHNIETRHRLGIVLEENDDHEGALAIWRDALEARPDWTHGRSHVAKALARLGKHDAALAESRTVMERSPDTLSSHLFHSEVQALCGDEDGARTTLQDAVERFPKSAMALRRLGAFLTNHDNEEAVRCLRKALEIAPDDESTLQNLGVALRNLRDFKGAIEADRKAIALLSEGETNPQFLAMCHGGLGHSLLELGDFKEAEQELGKAIALDPANANYHAQLGYARSWQRNLRGAVAAFREAARLEPENWLWWRDLWNGHTNLGDFERGLEALRRAAELNPVLRAFIATYLCDQLCRWDDAIAEFRRLRQANPTDAYAHSNTGVAFRGKRDYAQAILWHRKGIALAPEDPVLWMALGNTLERSGDLNGALDAYRKAKELGRSHPQLARLEKFLAWRAAGEPDDLSPPDRAAMARVLEFTGRHDMSLRFFRQAFEQSPSLQRQHMYPAMRVAVLAGAREQALAWMRYFLEVQAETAAVAPGGAMGNLLSTLHSRDFAPVRDAPDLPEEWKAFWRDLEALRAHIVAEARK